MKKFAIVVPSLEQATPFADFKGGQVGNVQQFDGRQDANRKFLRFDAGTDKSRMADLAEVCVLHNGNKSQGILVDGDDNALGEAKPGGDAFVSEAIALKRAGGRLALK